MNYNHKIKTDVELITWHVDFETTLCQQFQTSSRCPQLAWRNFAAYYKVCTRRLNSYANIANLFTKDHSYNRKPQNIFTELQNLFTFLTLHRLVFTPFHFPTTYVYLISPWLSQSSVLCHEMVTVSRWFW